MLEATLLAKAQCIVRSSIIGTHENEQMLLYKMNPTCTDIIMLYQMNNLKMFRHSIFIFINKNNSLENMAKVFSQKHDKSIYTPKTANNSSNVI